MNTRRNVYAAVTNTHSSTHRYAKPAPGVAEWCTASMIASLEKKPLKPGMPAEAIAPISIVQ
jgi:hypothetical protein